MTASYIITLFTVFAANLVEQDGKEHGEPGEQDAKSAQHARIDNGIDDIFLVKPNQLKVLPADERQFVEGLAGLVIEKCKRPARQGHIANGDDMDHKRQRQQRQQPPSPVLL